MIWLLIKIQSFYGIATKDFDSFCFFFQVAKVSGMWQSHYFVTQKFFYEFQKRFATFLFNLTY